MQCLLCCCHRLVLTLLRIMPTAAIGFNIPVSVSQHGVHSCLHLMCINAPRHPLYTYFVPCNIYVPNCCMPNLLTQNRMRDLRHLPRPATTRLRVLGKSHRFANLQRQPYTSTKAARLEDMADKYQGIFLDQVIAAMILLTLVMEKKCRCAVILMVW